MRLPLLLLLFPLLLPAQSDLGLTALYAFESNPGDATGDATNLGVPEGAVDYDCGVSGQGLLLTEEGDFVRIPGGGGNNVNREFDDEDLTVSLYFKPDGTDGDQVLLSKRGPGCVEETYLLIAYQPATRTVTARLEAGGNTIVLRESLANQACWQHVALVRDLTAVRLYFNGRRVAEGNTPDRADVDNTGDLLIGASDCPATDGTSFRGLIDELRVYGRPLDDAEVAALYLFPDRVLTPPTQLFLGESVAVDLNSNCGTGFSWTPTTGVVAINQAEPTITPTEAGRRVYRVSISEDQTDCIALDSLVLTVIDPDDLDCTELFLPGAFTPNGIGPAENETFGIANPFAIPDLVSFEIYDRNGGLMFRTDDAFSRWDGNFEGQPVNPGVVLWRVVYLCEEQEVVDSGTVTILR